MRDDVWACLAAFLTLVAGAIPAGAFEYSGVSRSMFSGDDSGTWEARVDTERTVTGSGVSEQAGNFLFSGLVSESGELRAIAMGRCQPEPSTKGL